MKKKSKKYSEDDEAFFAACMGMFALFYILPSIICFLTGITDAHSVFKNGCDRPLTKIEYIYPAHALGCWMNKQEF